MYVYRWLDDPVADANTVRKLEILGNANGMQRKNLAPLHTGAGEDICDNPAACFCKDGISYTHVYPVVFAG